MTGRSHITMALALALFAATATASAEQTYYKWKDATGATRYSDKPPSKAKADVLHVRPGQGQADEAGKPPAAVVSDPLSSGESPALKAAEAKYRSDACTAARDDVRTLKSGAMLVSSGDAANARQLTVEERAAAADAAQQRVAKFCKAGATEP